MIEIVNADELDLDIDSIDQLCEILLPAFRKANIGESCNAFEFRHLWETLLTQDPPAALFILRENQEILGVLGGITYEDPLTGIKYAAEVVWRVAPKAGGQGWGMKLLQAFEWWARDQNCKRIVLHGSAAEVCNLGNKIRPLGYRDYQVEFMKEI